MKNEYSVINVFAASDKQEIKKKINNIIHTLCTEDIEKIANMDYNICVAYWDGTSDLNEKEVSEEC